MTINSETYREFWSHLHLHSQVFSNSSPLMRFLSYNCKFKPIVMFKKSQDTCCHLCVWGFHSGEGGIPKTLSSSVSTCHRKDAKDCKSFGMAYFLFKKLFIIHFKKLLLFYFRCLVAVLDAIYSMID